MTHDASRARITRADGEMPRATRHSLNIHSPLRQALMQALGTRPARQTGSHLRYFSVLMGGGGTGSEYTKDGESVVNPTKESPRRRVTG